MSRLLPEKPNLEYLKKQAKELLRSMRQGKLADAQHTLANEYGFATWAKLKSHVEALGLSPAEALKAAVCDSDAPRLREVLERYPELRAKIDDPLVIRQNCVRDHVITLQRVRNGDEDLRSAGLR